MKASQDPHPLYLAKHVQWHKIGNICLWTLYLCRGYLMFKSHGRTVGLNSQLNSIGEPGYTLDDAYLSIWCLPDPLLFSICLLDNVIFWTHIGFTGFFIAICITNSEQRAGLSASSPTSGRQSWFHDASKSWKSKDIKFRYGCYAFSYGDSADQVNLGVLAHRLRLGSIDTSRSSSSAIQQSLKFENIEKAYITFLFHAPPQDIEWASKASPLITFLVICRISPPLGHAAIVYRKSCFAPKSSF